MKNTLLPVGILLLILLLPKPCFATTVYVTDSFKITLRSGPSTEHRILFLLPSGQPLEVIETQGDWSHVKVLGRGDPPLEGWVLRRYLVQRLPWKKQAEALRLENTTLKEKLNKVQKEILTVKQSNAELARELEEGRKALKDVTARYNRLKQGASQYLELKKKYEEVREELERNQAVIERLTRENNQYRYSEKRKWFALGAMVLLCGLLIGIVIGRQQRKRRSYIY